MPVSATRTAVPIRDTTPHRRAECSTDSRGFFSVRVLFFSTASCALIYPGRQGGCCVHVHRRISYLRRPAGEARRGYSTGGKSRETRRRHFGREAETSRPPREGKVQKGLVLVSVFDSKPTETDCARAGLRAVCVYSRYGGVSRGGLSLSPPPPLTPPLKEQPTRSHRHEPFRASRCVLNSDSHDICWIISPGSPYY